MIPSDLTEKTGTAAECAAIVAEKSGRFITILRHVSGDTFVIRVVAMLLPPPSITVPGA